MDKFKNVAPKLTTQPKVIVQGELQRPQSACPCQKKAPTSFIKNNIKGVMAKDKDLKNLKQVQNET